VLRALTITRPPSKTPPPPPQHIQAENSVLSVLSRSINSSAACAAGVLRWLVVILNTPSFYNDDRLVVWLPGFLRLIRQVVDTWHLHRGRSFVALVAAVSVRSSVDGLKVIECKREVLRLVFCASLPPAEPLSPNHSLPVPALYSLPLARWCI
jgi:hypothetical protein